ncbi:MAG: Segregation and condensation protein [Devosia sp.]|nr:Segregation and condensation protein [Devosia sp.]
MSDEHPLAPDPALRILEALLFAAAEPLTREQLSAHLPANADVEHLLDRLARHYSTSGVNLVRRGDGWAFRTAPDLAFLLRTEQQEPRTLSRAALETLAIIAYHQPATRAEIESIRGVAVGKGTMDILLETGWVRLRGRRRVPGRPVTYGTTSAFLDHFGLQSLGDLPGLEDLKGAGLLTTRPPASLPLRFEPPLGDDDDPPENPDQEDQG